MIKNVTLLLLATIGSILPFGRQCFGQAGSAIHFDGANDYMVVSNFANFPTTNITVEFWMRSGDISKNGTPFSYFSTNPVQSIFSVESYQNFKIWVNRTNASSGISANDGTWHHIAVTWQTNGATDLYKDGILVWQAALSAGEVLNTNGILTLGQFQGQYGGGFSAVNAFLGELDEVRVWNTVLSITDIQDNMARTLTGTEPNLAAYWKFNEDSGTTVADSSGHGRTGKLVNGPAWTNAPATPPIDQTFYKLFTFPARMNAAAAWGDYDNDGNLDFILSGGPEPALAETWHNDGSGGFTLDDTSFTGVSYAKAAWADFDHANYLDVVLAGTNVAGLTAYVDEGGTFYNYGLLSGPVSSFAIGDYDNDGNPDIVAEQGIGDGTTPQTVLLHGSGQFTGFFNQVSSPFPNVIRGSVAWADFDNDGLLDLLITGDTGTNYITQIWKNYGGGVFSNLNLGLPGVVYSAVAVGDYDNDGYMDFVLIGTTNGSASGAISRLYRNNHNGTFTLKASFPGYFHGSVAWGDYNNDGYLDLVFSGEQANGLNNTMVYYGTGTTFGTGMELTDISFGTAVWGDYDNDGRLDILLAGSPSGTEIWRNNTTTPNTTPAAPAGLSFTSSGTSANLNWLAGSDAETPAKGLTYNVRVGTSSGGTETLSPLALTDGTRLLPAFGNAQGRLFLPLQNLTPGITYYWSVQTIDGAFAGSAFAPESTFWVYAPPGVSTTPPTQIQYGSATLNGAVNPNGAGTSYYFEYGPTTNYGLATAEVALVPTNNTVIPVFAMVSQLQGGYYHYRVVASNAAGISYGNDVTFGAAAFHQVSLGLTNVTFGTGAWGDYDNDGWLDLLAMGLSGSSSIGQLLHNNGNGSFSNVTSSGIFPGNNGSVAWGDANLDGFLDLAVVGKVGNNFVSFAEVRTNNGAGNFNVWFNQFLPPGQGINNGTVAWGDYDNDGLPDLLVSGVQSIGIASNAPLTQIWRNTGNNTLNLVNSNFTQLTDSSGAWCDFNKDGLLDFAVCGNAGLSSTPVTKIYRNNGDGTFTDIGAALPGVALGQVAWGDYDGDGYPDLFITGSGISRLYHNNGDGTFTLSSNAVFTGLYDSSVAWGDFDNDGHLDIALAGYDGANYHTYIYHNNGDGTFSDMGVPLPGTSFGHLAWGDYDKDGRLDLFLTGQSPAAVSQLWQNQTGQGNTAPLAPSVLNASVITSTATLNWNDGSDQETPASALAYNVRVGSAHNAADLVSPESAPDGTRRVPDFGNAGEDHVFVRKHLAPGKRYYWSVQTVDGAFAGSLFSYEAQFTVGIPLLTTPTVSQIGPIDALATATVNPVGYDTTVWFEWGTTPNFGNTTAPQAAGNTNGPVQINNILGLLQPGVTYYLDLVASNAYIVVHSATNSFAALSESAPTISAFNNIAIAANSSTGPIPFTIGDAETSASNLLVAASASSPLLVPPTQLVLGGSGSNRTLTITPASNAVGTVAITVTVSDGIAFTARSFTLIIGSPTVPGDTNNDGIVDQNELNAVLANYWPNSPWIYMTNATVLGGGNFEFALTNATGWDFSVLVSTNLTDWQVLPTLAYPVYQFYDSNAAAGAQKRYYRLRYP